jgi:hypothetical protein
MMPIGPNSLLGAAPCLDSNRRSWPSLLLGGFPSLVAGMVWACRRRRHHGLSASPFSVAVDADAKVVARHSGELTPAQLAAGR